MRAYGRHAVFRRRAGFWPVYSETRFREEAVDFYYAEAGHHAPVGELGRNAFWTSSAMPDDGLQRPYVYWGGNGQLAAYPRTRDIGPQAVRCVR